MWRRSQPHERSGVDRYDNSHPEPLRAIPNRFGRDGGDETRRTGYSQRPSQPCADCRLGGRLNRFRRPSRLLRGYSAADGRLWNSRNCWIGAALGDARSAPRVARLIRGAFFVMLVADLVIPFYYTVQFSGLPWISVRRVATFALILPFLVAVAASSEVRQQIMERVRLVADFHMRGRFSCCGGAFSSHVDKPDRIHLSLGRRNPIVVCAVLCDDLYS